MKPPLLKKRMQRETRTVEVMIRRFCKDRHATKGDALCKECQELLAYALRRLHGCPFQENKTSCGKCPVHCYAPQMREKIRKVMRYAGPCLLLTHPVMAIAHLIDGLRKPRPRG